MHITLEIAHKTTLANLIGTQAYDIAMVHYNPPMFAAQIPPPICPKCGSHRTVIVGRSDDGETIVLRCNACGERSELSTNDAYTMPRTGPTMPDDAWMDGPD